MFRLSITCFFAAFLLTCYVAPQVIRAPEKASDGGITNHMSQSDACHALDPDLAQGQCGEMSTAESTLLIESSKDSDGLVASDERQAAVEQGNGSPDLNRSRLLKRQIDQQNDFRFTFYFSCPIAREMHETFVMRVNYDAFDDLVRLGRVRNIGTFSAFEQIQDGPAVHFDAYMHARLRRDFVDPRTGFQWICLYQYFAFVEGRVYSQSTVVYAAQPQDYENAFSPEVTEQCVRYRGGKDCTAVCIDHARRRTCDLRRIAVRRL